MLGRNSDLFDKLRNQAYNLIDSHRDCFDKWTSRLESIAQGINDEYDIPMSFNEVLGIVKSVAKWVWYEYTGSGGYNVDSELQRKRGRLSGLVRRRASEVKKQAARRLYDATVSINQIAVQLELSSRQIRRYLKGYFSPRESLQQLKRMFTLKENGHEPSGGVGYELGQKVGNEAVYKCQVFDVIP